MVYKQKYGARGGAFSVGGLCVVELPPGLDVLAVYNQIIMPERSAIDTVEPLCTVFTGT